MDKGLFLAVVPGISVVLVPDCESSFCSERILQLSGVDLEFESQKPAAQHWF